MIESLTINDDGAIIYRKPVLVDGVVTEYAHNHIAPGKTKPKEVTEAIKALEAVTKEEAVALASPGE